MASTNKTTHYELSQYVGSDKPTILTDYNNDMSAIDTGIYNAQTKANDAYTLADTADGKADTAQTTAETANSSAGSANTKIGTMANLTTTEKNTLVGAVNEVNYNLGLFNLTSYSTLTLSATNATIDSSSINLAKNANGSLFKVYGTINISAHTADSITITTSDTGLRPSSSYTINALGFRTFYTGASVGYPDTLSGPASVDVTVNTDGTLTINYTGGLVYPKARIILFPCLLFNSDFGDTPIPE